MTKLAITVCVFGAALLCACATTSGFRRGEAHGARGIASTGDPAFRAAMGDLVNLPNVMVPPAPYEFWEKRVDKLLHQNPEAARLVSEQSLSRDECIAIMAYSDTIYAVINRALWNHDGQILMRLGPVMKTLNQGLTKLPTYAGPVYRIVGFGGSVDRESVLRENKPGAAVNYLGYTSTSKDGSWLARPENQRPDAVFLIIESKNGRWIGPLTASALNGQSQEEVLFLPDSRFQVKGVDHPPSAPVTIHLEEAESQMPTN